MGTQSRKEQDCGPFMIPHQELIMKLRREKYRWHCDKNKTDFVRGIIYGMNLAIRQTEEQAERTKKELKRAAFRNGCMSYIRRFE